MASTSRDTGSRDCPLVRAASGVEIVHPERFCFGPAPALVHARAHVLVVDPVSHLAALTARMLADQGYAARWCIDARDVLDELDAGQPVDLLLMPAQDTALAAVVRKRHAHLRLLFTHGSGHRAPEFGEHIAKPFTRARLQCKVEAVLGTAADRCTVSPSA